MPSWSLDTLRSARSSARAHGSSGSAGWGAEHLPASRPAKKKELHPTRSRASIPHRRQQSVPHSGVREALLAPTAAPALPDEVRSVFDKRRKNSAPHGAELPSATGGSRACRTPECAKLCSRPRQLRLCRMRCGASSHVTHRKKKSSAPHGAELPSAAGGSRACRTPECANLPFQIFVGIGLNSSTTSHS